jgi:hypothetical protein
MNRALLNNSKSPRVLVDELLDIMLDYKLLVTAHRTGNGITLWAEKWRGSWSSGPPQRVRALMVPIVALISVYPPLLL